MGFGLRAMVVVHCGIVIPRGYFPQLTHFSQDYLINTPTLWDDKHIELEPVAIFLMNFGAYIEIYLSSK